MRKDPIKLNDISKNPGRPLAIVTPGDLMPLPAPCHDMNHPGTGPLTEGQQQRYEHSFDGVVALAIPKPQSKAEEDELVAKFLSGLKKLFSKENNWTFLQPLTLSMEY